jgi:enoyl ACP reductase
VGLLDGKRLLITGVLTDASLAFSVARLAQEEGADIVLSGAGRALSLTRRTARKLPREPEVLEIDVTSPEQLAVAGTALAARWDRLDGLLHAIGFAPPDCLGSGMFAADWDDVATAIHISTYSLKALIDAFLPLLEAAGAGGGASVVGLDFDATVAWPVYDWMGVAKAGRCRATWPRSSVPAASGSISWPPGPCEPWPPSRFRASAPSRTPGPTGRRSGGTSTTRRRWPRPASPSSATSSR